MFYYSTFSDLFHFFLGLAALLEWHHLLNYEIHTEASIKELQKRRIALQHTIRNNLQRSGCGWNTLKFFVLRKFEEVITEIGCAAIVDTGFLEALHKPLKESSRHTNNRPETAAIQISQHAQYKAAGQRVLDALAETPLERLSMVRNVYYSANWDDNIIYLYAMKKQFASIC